MSVPLSFSLSLNEIVATGEAEPVTDLIDTHTPRVALLLL